jgi:RNA polymerase sigma factor (sigma-70 family)
MGRAEVELRPYFPMSETPLDRLLAQRQQFLGFLLRRVPDAGIAEDILQNAYVQAIKQQEERDLTESATAWFYRILRNAVIDNFRRQQTRSKALEAWARELETTAQPSAQLEGDICACLTGVINELKPEYSEALRSVDLGGERLQDFARQHNLTSSNAGVRVHRARQALRKQLVRACGACADHGCLDCQCKQHS